MQNSGGILARQKSVDSYDHVRVGLSSLSLNKDANVENGEGLTVMQWNSPSGIHTLNTATKQPSRAMLISKDGAQHIGDKEDEPWAEVA